MAVMLFSNRGVLCFFIIVFYSGKHYIGSLLREKNSSFSHVLEANRNTVIFCSLLHIHRQMNKADCHLRRRRLKTSLNQWIDFVSREVFNREKQADELVKRSKINKFFNTLDNYKPTTTTEEEKIVVRKKETSVVDNNKDKRRIMQSIHDEVRTAVLEAEQKRVEKERR